MFNDAIDKFTGLIIYSDDDNIQNKIMYIANGIDIWYVNIPRVYTVKIYNSAHVALESIIEDIQGKGVIILARVEYGGYMVTKSYETKEYRSEIVK